MTFHGHTTLNAQARNGLNRREALWCWSKETSLLCIPILKQSSNYPSIEGLVALVRKRERGSKMRKGSEKKKHQQGLRPALVVEGLQISDGRIIWTQSPKSFTMTLLPHVHIEESQSHEPASLSTRVDTFRGTLQALETLVICGEAGAVRGVPDGPHCRDETPPLTSVTVFGKYHGGWGHCLMTYLTQRRADRVLRQLGNSRKLRHWIRRCAGSVLQRVVSCPQAFGISGLE